MAAGALAVESAGSLPRNCRTNLLRNLRQPVALSYVFASVAELVGDLYEVTERVVNGLRGAAP